MIWEKYSAKIRLTILLLILGICLFRVANAADFSFAVIGDTQKFNKSSDLKKIVRNLIKQNPAAAVIVMGDLGASNKNP